MNKPQSVGDRTELGRVRLGPIFHARHALQRAIYWESPDIEMARLFIKQGMSAFDGDRAGEYPGFPPAA